MIRLKERLKERFKQKLAGQRGFTLVEMLCAVVILGFLGLLLNTGMIMAARNYHDVTVISEVQVLASTLSNALIDDLRYARNVQLAGGPDLTSGVLASYDSDSYGDGVSFSLEDGQLLAGGMRILPSGAYRNGRYELAALPEITYQEGCFNVEIKVQEKGGTLYAENSFSVYCLNSEAL